MSVGGEPIATVSADANVKNVGELKHKVEKQTGISKLQQRFMYGDTVLTDGMLLDECGISDECEISMLIHPGVELTFVSDCDENGVFYYIGTSGLKQAWRNPALTGAVAVMRSSDGSGQACAAVGRDVADSHTCDEKGAWWEFDLGEGRRLTPNYYSVRHNCSVRASLLVNWDIEARNADSEWTCLRSHSMDNSLADSKSKVPVASWPLHATDSFRFFRLISTGPCSTGDHNICCSYFELYGMLYGEDAIDK